MKILSNVKFKGMVDKIKELEEEKEKIEKKYNNKDFTYLEDYNTYRDKCIKLEEVNEVHQKNNGLLRKENDTLKQEVKELQGAKGGYIARINRLVKTVEEAKVKFDEYREEKESEIADLKSDRYLKIECEPDKAKGNQKMQIYSARTSKNSEIIKRLKNNEK